jgi:hypothetical protein
LVVEGNNSVLIDNVASQLKSRLPLKEAYRSFSDKVDNINNFSGGGINESLEPVVLVFDLDNVSEDGVIVFVDNVLQLSRPVIVLGI